MSKAFTKEDSGGAELSPRLEDLELPRGPRYITPEGRKRLDEERTRLLEVDRPELLQRIREAQSDLHRAQEEQRLAELERRAGYLARLLDRLTVVEPQPASEGVVRFGAEVTLEDEDGRRMTWRLVGPDEVDVRARRISVESPVGRALLGKTLGDEVTIHRPRGEALLTVEEIRYPVESLH